MRLYAYQFVVVALCYCCATQHVPWSKYASAVMDFPLPGTKNVIYQRSAWLMRKSSGCSFELSERVWQKGIMPSTHQWK